MSSGKESLMRRADDLLSQKLARMRRLLPRTIVWVLLYSWLDIIAARSGGLPKRSVGARKTVIFVRVDLLGDVVLQLPALKQLAVAASRSGYDVKILCAPDFERFLQSELPVDVECLAVSRGDLLGNPARRFRTIKRLSALTCSIVAQLSWSRDLLGTDSIVRAVNAPRKLGLVGNRDNASARQLAIGNRFYSGFYKVPIDLCFHGDVNRWFARQLSTEIFESGRGGSIPFRYEVPGKTNRSPEFFVFPGTSRRTSFKRWPEHRFAEVIDEIVSKTGWRCIVAGTEDEIDVLRKVSSLASSRDIVIAAGNLSISSLRHRLGLAALAVGNDSGAMHLAAYAGTFAIVVCGGGHPGAFFPYPKTAGAHGPVLTARQVLECYGCGWHCTHKDRARSGPYPCVSEVSVAAVKRLVLQVVNEIETDERTAARGLNQG